MLLIYNIQNLVAESIMLIEFEIFKVEGTIETFAPSKTPLGLTTYM